MVQYFGTISRGDDLKKSKRITAIILCVIVLTGCVTAGVLGFAAEQEFEPNKVLLEELLDGRSWVIDTLVNNDFSTNPYCKNIPSTVFGGESFNITHNMTDSILDTYEGVFGLDFTVKSLYYFYNSKAVIQTLEDEAVDEVEQDLGFSPGESATFLSDCSKSINEQLYDSILNNVFLEEYTASDGTKLNEDMDSLTDLRYIKKEANYAKSFVDMLGTLQTCLEKNDISYAQGYDGLSTFEDELKYDTGDFDKALVSYMGFFDKYEKMLDSYGKTYGASVKGASDRSAVSKKAEALAASSGLMLLKLMCLNDANYKKKIEAVAQNEETQKIWAPTAADYFKTVGKTFELASSAIDNYVLIEKMFDYDSSIAATLDRCSAQCDIWNLQESYNRYSAYLDEASAQKVAAYKTITDFVSKNNIVYSLVNKGIGKYVKEILPAELAAKGLVNVKSYASTLNEIGLIIKAADFATNQLFDARNLIQCIYEILFIQDIINDAIGAYNDDLSAYQSHPTEENAKFVLDDLDFIKRLRLYSEKVAYKIYKGQQDKGLGLLVNALTGQTVEQLNERNQRITDAYICARLNPVPLKPFELNNATIEISVDEYNNAVAVVTMANGKKYNINEFERVCGAGIVLNKSNLTIVSESDTPCYIPFTYISGQSEISADKSSSLEIGEIVFTSSGKLITAVDDSGALAVRYNIDFANTGATVGGNIELAGSVNGSGIFSGGLTLTAAEEDCEIASSLSVNCLTLNSSKYISFNAPVTVTGSVSNSRTKTKNAANLIITGSCTVANGSYFGGFTAKDWTCPGSVTVKGDLIANGTNTINGSLTVNGGFDASGENKSLTVNGSFNAHGDFNYTAGTISGLGSLNLYGDANFGNLTVSLENLNICGSTMQTVTAANGVTLKNLNNLNSSLGGLRSSGKITVTDSLYSADGARYADGSAIYLTGNCTVSGNYINGSINSENWICADDLTVTKEFYSTGTLTVNEDVVLDVGSFIKNSGSTEFKTGTLLLTEQKAQLKTVTGAAVINASCDITADSISCYSIYVVGNFNSGTLNCTGNCLVTGDADIKGKTAVKSFELTGDFNSTDSVTADEFIFNGAMAQNFKAGSTSNIKSIRFDNNSLSGVTVKSRVNVSEDFYMSETATAFDGTYIYLIGNCRISSNYINGSLNSDGWTCTDDFTVTQGFNATGTFTLAEGKTLTAASFTQKSGSAVLKDNAALVIGGFAEMQSVTGTGNITADGIKCASVTCKSIDVKDDFYASGAVNADTVTFSNDFYAGSKSAINTLNVNSKIPQTVSLASQSTVGTLQLGNTSKSGVTVTNTVVVTEKFNNLCKNISGAGFINIGDGCEYCGSSEYNGDLTLLGSFTFPAVEKFTVNGNLVKKAGTVTVQNDTQLEINGDFTASGGTFNMGENSVVNVNKALISSSAVFGINGTLNVSGHMLISSGSITLNGVLYLQDDSEVSGTISGGGKMTVNGDFNGSATVKGINVDFISTVPQKIKGTSLTFNNITVSNTSLEGLTINSAVKYSGRLNKGTSVIRNESNLTAA